VGASLQSLKNGAHFLQALGALLYFKYPASQLTVIGVTGTDGKTTTATLIYHLLKSTGHKVALVSTVAAYIGDELIDTGFHVTSPGSWQLQRLLRRIVSEGYTHLVLECTSHGLDQHRLLGTNIRTAVVTNVTHEHLDYHKTYAAYLKAKSKIFNGAKTAIINADDTSFASLVQTIPPGCMVVPYSLSENTQPALLSDDDYQNIQGSISKLFDETYNRSNALAASLAAQAIGIASADIVRQMPSFPGVPGRMQVIKNTRHLHVVVDFAHTPNALKQVLTAAEKACKRHLIVVFGAAGARDQSKRPIMGQVAASIADEIILTAEDPRHEDVYQIIAHIKEGAQTNRGHLHSVPDRRQAIQFALKLAQIGDTVVVCGKGHEQSMNLDGIHEIPWSDAKVLEEELSHL